MQAKYVFTALMFFWFQSVFAQLELVENKGQWDKAILYRGDWNHGSVFLERTGFSVNLHQPEQHKKLSEAMHGGISSKEAESTLTMQSVFYRVELVGGNPNPEWISEKPLSSYNNYFLGKDPSKWAGNCRIFQAVTYRNVYPNIDLRYYSQGNEMKYDFLVHPGGDPEQILLRYSDPVQLALKHRKLLVQTPVGLVEERIPSSYQSNDDGQREEIGCKYKLNGRWVSFQVKKFDPKKLLVIDPSILFSSFTGSSADNWGFTATPGPDGSLYAGGIVFGAGYPSSPGAYQTTYAGGVVEDGGAGYDISIFKFSSDGSRRLYATYLGGSGNEQPHSLIADSRGNLIIAGRSNSSNFPVLTNNPGSGGGYDIILSKLASNGAALLGSVKIGGSNDDGLNIAGRNIGGAVDTRRNYGDDARSEVTLNRDGKIILVSCTKSTNFPTTGIALNGTNANAGRQDGLIIQYSSDLRQYEFGSYFGGDGDDACFVVSVNPINGNIFIGGGSTSNTLPRTISGVYQRNYQGGESDGFVAEIANDFGGLVKTTFMGTSGNDIVFGLKHDRKGFPYIVGTTTGSWPILNANYQTPNSAQFISKLKPDLSGFIYSTTFGNGSREPNLSPIGFMVDRCENVYVSGWGGGINNNFGFSNGNTNGLPLLNPLNGVSSPDTKDLYFFVMERNANSLLFASNFGQFNLPGEPSGDHVDGGTSRFDDNGAIYQAICANCGGGQNPFPTTPGVWSRFNNSSNCNLAAVKIEMNFAGVDASVRPVINSRVNDTSGCVPFRVDFTDTLQKGKTMYWDFGNGEKDTTRSPNFSTFTNYNVIGIYTAMVISEDSTSCNIRDTAFIIIKAGVNNARLDFRAVKDSPCTGFQFNFQNLSVPTEGVFSSRSFVWNFGDGSAPDTALNPSHNFPREGQYMVILTLIDDYFCNAPVSDTLMLTVKPLVEAKFRTDSVGCAPYSAQLTNLSGTPTVLWQFSNGNSSTSENPVELFSNPGTYQVRLIATDSNTCNKVDTSDYYSIRVSDKPDAAFTWSPNPPEINTPTRFNNQTTGAVRYQWFFGDGNTTTDVNPTYQFNAEGDFTVTLVANNQVGCTDTFTTTVSARINPLLDVPNAFTPGRDGANSVIRVRGFGIAKMKWNIYNRWGQLIFQSTNPAQGWDGTYKGKLQPMDVYIYTLDVEFSNGNKISNKTGDISLIR
jgi:gliding motility-associated-like protein